MDTAMLDLIISRVVFMSIVVFAAIIASILTVGFIYLIVLYIRLKKREQMAYDMSTFEIKIPRENEIKIDAAEQMFSSLSSIKKNLEDFSAFLRLETFLLLR